MPPADDRRDGIENAAAGLAAPGHVKRPRRPFGAAKSVSWAGTALPLTACVAIWGIGDAAPAEVAWLTIAHGIIGTAASVWTVLQLALRWQAPKASSKAAASWPRPSLLAIYILLLLQPLLAIASSMLHGDNATLFGIPLPSVLPTDQHAALQVDRLHGGNALLLLALIAFHVGKALQSFRRPSTEGPGRATKAS